MQLEDKPDDNAHARDQEEGSWLELFPFVLMAVALVATLVAVVIIGDQ